MSKKIWCSCGRNFTIPSFIDEMECPECGRIYENDTRNFSKTGRLRTLTELFQDTVSA